MSPANSRSFRPSPTRGEKIFVGLSGGVDSAVAALMLCEQGFAVEGLFMKNWEEDDSVGYCAAAEDLAYAEAVANRLGVPLHKVNFATEYWDRVFTRFLDEHRAGRTPNPDVLCNKEIKFQAFLDHALDLGATGIATGHYARISHDAGRARLRLSADADKDQTYFLYLLDQNQLRLSHFPLADLTKLQVRRMARDFGFANAAKPDSTGICFIGERPFRDFLARYLPNDSGPIETPDGQVLGVHRGVAYYTIGQRKGLGIGGATGFHEAPWFVAAKDLARNALIVVQGADHPLLMARELEGEPLHWIAGNPPGPAPYPCLARLRHRQPLQGCEILSYDESGCRVRFEHPQRAVTPGQALVLYRGEECLGGAVIRHACR